MKSPSPMLLIILSLIAAAKVIDQPLVRAVVIGALFVMVCLIAAHFLMRRDGLTLLLHAFVRVAPSLPVGRIRMWAFPPPGTRIGKSELTPTRAGIVRDLALVLAVALGVRGVWAVVIPPWQAPDEPVHYLYTAHIVEQGEIPHATTTDDPAYPAEVVTSRNLTLLGKLSGVGVAPTHDLPYLPVTYDYGAARAYEGSERDRQWPGPLTDYPPLYYLFCALPYWLFRHGPIISRLYAVRYASVCLGALSCLFAYLMAYELRRSRRWGLALGLAMALMPMHVFITSVANNDAAVDLAAIILIWLIIRIYLRDEASMVLTLAIGVTSGLAMLTKQTTLPLVVVAGMIVAMKAFTTSRPHRHSLRNGISALGLWAASALLAYSPWIALRYHYYREVKLLTVPVSAFLRLLGVSTVVHASAALNYGEASHPVVASLFAMPHPSPWSYLLYEKGRGISYFGWLLVRSFWGDFGWLDAPLPGRVYGAIVVFSLIGGAGLLVQLLNQPARRPVLLLLVGLLVVQTLFLFVGVDYYEGFVRTGKEFGLQGRYFFPILAPLLFVLMSGWDHLWGENPLGLRIAMLGMAALNVAGLATVLARYYGVVIG